jgi:hypothetical protein
MNHQQEMAQAATLRQLGNATYGKAFAGARLVRYSLS